jgi:opacity protein-like surface antigen
MDRSQQERLHMSPVSKSALLAALITAFAVVPDTAGAQEQRFRVSFAPSVAAIGGDAELALGGTAAYRFSEHFWFEGEVTWLDAAAGGLRERHFGIDLPATYARGLEEVLRRQGGIFGRNAVGLPGLPNLPVMPILPIYPYPISAAVDGSTWIATVGMRYELPGQTDRFRPYVAGGLGINITDQELRIEPLAIDASSSRTGFAFNGGAGASVRVWRQLWADVDGRYFRLSGDRDIMRLGGGVSVRF